MKKIEIIPTNDESLENILDKIYNMTLLVEETIEENMLKLENSNKNHNSSYHNFSLELIDLYI